MIPAAPQETVGEAGIEPGTAAWPPQVIALKQNEWTVIARTGALLRHGSGCAQNDAVSFFQNQEQKKRKEDV
jgi:hypothetical protein